MNVLLYTGPLLIAIVVAHHLRRIYHFVIVRGHSMSPTLTDGQRILMRASRTPARGQLAVFADPRPPVADDHLILIKRVTAVSGDPMPPEVPSHVAHRLVPPGMLVVRGDNPRSRDSRHFGLVPQDAVLGTVIRPRTELSASPGSSV